MEKEKLLKIANLASIEIKDDEVEEYAKNLENILEYTKILDKVDYTGFKETVGTTENYNVFRKDEVVKYEDIDLILKNAKETDRGMYKLPTVIE